MDWKKYIYTFGITAIIFITAILASNYFGQKKLDEIKDIESRIAVDILASETQFSLLSELSCRDISSSLLSKELATLGDRLSYTEESRGSDDLEVLNLKKYYSLLQIKDFLLMQKITERCGKSQQASSTLSIIYFYSNEGDCKECQKEGFVLTRLRQEYPELRVYSFDYNLDLSALQTLITVYNIRPTTSVGLPALLINDKVYYGFKSIEDIKDSIPILKEIDKQKEAGAKNSATTTEQ